MAPLQSVKTQVHAEPFVTILATVPKYKSPCRGGGEYCRVHGIVIFSWILSFARRVFKYAIHLNHFIELLSFPRDIILQSCAIGYLQT